MHFVILFRFSTLVYFSIVNGTYMMTSMIYSRCIHLPITTFQLNNFVLIQNFGLNPCEVLYSERVYFGPSVNPPPSPIIQPQISPPLATLKIVIDSLSILTSQYGYDIQDKQ